MVARRSYPTSEVRGSGPECQAVTAQEQPRGATPDPRSGAAAGKSHPTFEVRGNGLEEPPRVRGQGSGLRAATLQLRPGAAAGKINHVQGAVASLVKEGLEELSHVEGREGWW